ncbi:MAG TPA: amidohydrolase family protein [Caldilineae bacterium]|nr:amidohydrolase family protein [Caldilineae bacterium]
MFRLPDRYPRLRDVVEQTPLIDTHEHLQEERERLALGDRLDFAYLFRAYLLADLISAGMADTDAENMPTDALDQDEKWRRVARYWERVRYTGYGQAIALTIREVYGIADLNQHTYRDVTAAMRAHNKPGVHHWLLREKAGVAWYILHDVEEDGDVYRDETDPGLCRQALAVNRFLEDPLPLDRLAARTGIRADSWEAFLATIDWYFERYGREAVAIKNNCPYWRSLYFEDVSPQQAAAAFEKRYVRGQPLEPGDLKALQDATFHHCLRRAAEYDLPVQIHTGYLAGNRNLDLERIRPGLLTNLFVQYPSVRFDLFHIGYPYQSEVAALAKNYPNVYIDLCWAWIIDPYATRRALQTFISAVPVNKIFGFGGDVRMADGVYGHARFARWGVAWALTEMIDEGYLGEEDACVIARRVLHDNAQAFFKL